MAKRSRRKRIPTDTITAEVMQLNHEGRGIVHVNGKTTFLFGALPGETVEFRYIRCHRQYDEGVVTNVLKASKDRVAPLCPHFGICGGCSMQHASSDMQRAHKQSVLLEHFQHQANCQPESIMEPLYAAPWEYRRRARLSVRFVPKKEAVLVGFRERGTSFVAELNACNILHPSIGRKIKVLSDVFMQCEMKSDIAQVEVAVADNATAIVVRHMVELPETDIEKLTTFARDNHLHLYFQPKGPESIHPVFPENPEALFYEMPDHQIKMVFKPSQFTQINQDINLKMINRALELLELKKSDRALDLFCGIGNFSLPMAKYCSAVVGVEGAESSIIQAQNNAIANNIHNATFYTQDLSADLSHAVWSKDRYDKVLLDPARLGAKELMPHIAVWQPERIVYVSCNPITLARDTKDLLQLGYHLEKAGVMDMFPHTDHIEAIALFVRAHH
jgi:23S rRNA (uracil1939-C5)-methyltransferase